MPDTNRRPSAAELQAHLKGLNYPAKKEDVLNMARENGANEDVLRALESLSGDSFGGLQDIMRAYGGESALEEKET